MRKRIGRVFNRLMHSYGYHLTPIPKIIPKTTEKNWAEKLDIQTIIDIGSNEGQFINEINSLLPQKKIFAFEPIPECYQKLLENTKHANVTAFNIGLSDTKGATNINVSNNLVSSSILEMKDLHKTSYPESHFVKTQQISIEKLDDTLQPFDLQGNILIKMDVQGYERQVIKGGEKTFLKASALIIESIFEPFYEGQWLFDDLYDYFTRAGFKFMGFTDQVNSPKTGIPLYADSIFIKKGLVAGIL